MNVWDNLSADITAEIEGICIGTTTPLSVSNLANVVTTTGATYKWQKSATADGTYTDITGANNDTYDAPIHEAGKTYYKVIITDADRNGDCKTLELTTSVNVWTTPSVTINTNDTTVCKGEDLTLTTTTSGGNANSYSYKWYKDNTLTDITTYNYTPTTDTYGSSTTYKVVVDDGCNNNIEKSAVVKVYSAPSVNAGEDVTICANSSTTLTATAQNGKTGYKYQWFNGNTNLTEQLTTNTYATEDNAATSGNSITYTVVVTDGCNVTVSDDVKVTAYDALTITKGDSSDITCHGGNNGVINVSVTGGKANYYYKIDNGNFGDATSNVTAQFSNLEAGSHTVSVKDQCGTEESVTFVLKQPAELSLSNEDPQAIQCHGGASSITVTATGGTTPYQFKLGTDGTFAENAGNSKTFSDLRAGTYTIYVKDNCEVTKNVTVQLTEPNALTLTKTSSTDITCHGGQTGKVKVTAAYGTTPYQFKIDDGTYQSTNDNVYEFEGLGAGSHTVYVKDNCDTIKSVTFVLTEPAELSLAKGDSTDVACYNAHTGIVSVNASNGTTPYQFKIDNGDYQPSNEFEGLGAGSHTVYVKDGCAAEKTVTFVLEQPDELTVVEKSNTHKNVTCNGAGNGSITVTADGGTGKYRFSKDNGETWSDAQLSGEFTFNSLSAGTNNDSIYHIKVKDENECTTSSLDIHITQPEPLTLTETHVDVACTGEHEGSITVTPQGGTPSYKYFWDGGTQTGANTLSGLASGEHTIKVMDANSCEYTLTVTLSQPTEKLKIDSVATNITCNAAHDGTITVTPTGGTAPYRYFWSDNQNLANTTSSRTALEPGSYTVTVYDSHDCSVSRTYKLSEPAAVTVTLTVTHDVICSYESTTFTATPSITDVTMQWKKDGSLITDSIRTELANIKEAGTYMAVATYTGNNSTPCPVNSQEITLTVNQAPQFGLTVDHSTICAGEVAEITAASTNSETYTYAWSGTGLSADGNPRTFTTETAGTHTISVTATSSANCTSTETTQITVNALPAFTVAIANSEICADGSTTLTATPDNASEIYNYEWDGAGLSETTGSTNTFSGMPGGSSYNITVTATNPNTNCTNEVTPEIQVKLLPSAELTCKVNNEPATPDNGTLTLCAGGSVELTVPAGGDGYTYTWYKGGVDDANKIAGATTNKLTTLENVTTADDGEYYVVVKGSNGCDSTNHVHVTVNALPEVTLTSAPAADEEGKVAICYGEEVDLTVSTTATTIAWSDNQLSGSNVTVSTEGSYKVTVTDGNGCSQTSNEIKVTVNPLPSFTLESSNGTDLCYGVSTNITASSSSDLTYTWATNSYLTGDATNTRTFSGAPASSDSYIITVTGKIENTGCTKDETINITVHALPDFTIQAPAVCLGGEVALSVSPENTYTYAWASELANALSQTTGNSVNFTTANTAAVGDHNYMVTVTATTTSYSCTASKTTQVYVRNLPTQSDFALTSNRHVCKGGELEYTIPTSYSNYTWSSSLAGALSGNDGPSVTFTGSVTGTHTITVSVTDDNSCVNSTSASVIVDTLPVIPLTSENAVCQDSYITFTTNDASDITGYTWTYPTANATVDGGNNGSTLKVKWSGSGSWAVSVNFTDGNGCTATEAASKEITVNPLPNVYINEQSPIGLCLGDNQTLSANANSTCTYEWSNGVGTGAQVTVTPTTDSTFTVTGKDGNGCANTASIEINVYDSVTFTATNTAQELCLGVAIEAITIDSANCTVEWNLPTGLSYNESTKQITGTISEAGNHDFHILATNGNNCRNKDVLVSIIMKDTVSLSAGADTTQILCLGEPIAAIVIDTAHCSLSYTLPTGLSYNMDEHRFEGAIGTAGTHDFIVTASNGNNCGQKSIGIHITMNDTVHFEADNATQVLCMGQAIEPISIDSSHCTIDWTQLPNDLEYDPADRIITGQLNATTTFDITATNTACPGSAKAITFSITINDTVKITAAEGDVTSITRKLCKGAELNEIKLWATRGTIGFGSGNIPTDLTNTSTYSDTIRLNGTMNVAGTYEFYVLATGTDCGTSKDSMKVIITVDTLPAVTITTPDATICPNGQQNATLTATAGYNEYTWKKVGADDVLGTENAITVMPDAETNYTVTVKNGEGCVNTSDAFTVSLHTINVSTINNAHNGTEGVCNGTTTQLKAEATGAATFEWIGYTTPSATGSILDVTLVQDSIFSVSVLDENNCYDTATYAFTVFDLPEVNITSDVNAICQNGTIHFSADPGHTTYVWKDGNTQVGTNSATYDFVTTIDTTPGEHIISVQITDTHTGDVNCVQSDTRVVTVNRTPILSKASVDVRCFGDYNGSITLTVDNVVGTPTYAWKKNNSTTTYSTDKDLTDIYAGTYTVVVTTGDECLGYDTVTISEPTALTATFNTDKSNSQLCGGIGKVVVTPDGGTYPYSFEWTGDGIISGSENSDTLKIQNLTLGVEHAYTVKVKDEHSCEYTITTPWIVSSNRTEVYRELTISADETPYIFNGTAYSHDGDVFEEVYPNAVDGECDSVIIFTLHVYGIGMHFADDFTVQHSSIRKAYKFYPDIIGDTIRTTVNTNNMFYAYVSTDADSLNSSHVDMRYEVIFNDNPISNEDFDETVEKLKISSYYEHEDYFCGHDLDSARGEVPATSFVYQVPNNSTGYFFDYFNFTGFNKMPQKVEFNFSKPGTYVIKFYVEKRLGTTTYEPNHWGIYNPYVLNGTQPEWGGLGDSATSRQTIVARYMTVIVGEPGSNPAISSIDEYTKPAEPTVNTYPNPAHEMLYLDINGMEGRTFITITDAAGKVVARFQENLLDSETVLNYSVATFAQGIYFLNVQNNDTVITKKFIVTK